jgi:cell division protein FtsI (penicillin-binding protein 3)
LDPRAEELALKRLRIFARVCLVWAIIILGRLFQLQIVDHSYYSHLAQRQHERRLEIRAPRGTIYDRNGLPLAMSVPVDSVCINPQKVPDVAIAAGVLARVLKLDERVLATEIREAVARDRGFLWVKRKITTEEANSLRSYKFDWIEFRNESMRFYPKGTLAAHLLGGVDHEEKGNGGIEQSQDKSLRGVPGIALTTADVRRAVFEQKVYLDPQPGANLTLTIDERIQYIAETELEKAVKEADAISGSLVAMDPRTGEVLALANYPTFDPNEPPKNEEEFLARRNISVSAPFEPGSIFKVITLAAALETTRLRPESTFFCHNGAFTLFRRVIHDAKPHGTLTMADVLAKSSNIGSIKIALSVGTEKFHEYIRRFGFASLTHVGLPGESRGFLYPVHRWIPSSIGSVAMGHEISTTAVQLARACSVIANGGFLVKPRLVMQTARAGEAPVVSKAEMQQVLKPETAMTMRMMMQGVVDHGTGKRAQLKGYSAAGKTGSAQIVDPVTKTYIRRYNGSFMGFAPVNNPRIAIVITLNRTKTGSSGFGGIVAAPVFQKVASAALRFMDVPKDLPEDVEPTPEEEEPEPDVTEPDPLRLAELEQPEGEIIPVVQAIGPKTPDFTGKSKREVLSESMATGVKVVMSGSGVVRQQEPLPGAVLQPGQRVRVVFAR